MIDWEMKARQLAEHARTLAVVIGIVAVVMLVQAETWQDIIGACFLAYCCMLGFDGAKIET